ncbi:MAG: GGDEF domain-containing protein [Pontibacterium sp.]
MSVQNEDWKQKYRELASEYAQSQQLEQSLNQIVGSMVLALEGNDAQLDLELRELKHTLRPDTDKTSLGRLRLRLDKHIRLRDESREEQAKVVLEAFRRWIAYLRDMTQQPSMLDTLDIYQARSQKLENACDELPSLLQDLVALQAEINPPAALVLSEESIDSYVEGVTPGSEEQNRLLRTVAAELSELVTGLYLPEKVYEQSEQLVRIIRRGFDLSELPALLRQVIRLVGKAGPDNSQEFEGYLLDLSAQLAEVEAVVQKNRKDQQDSDTGRFTLDKNVRSNVQQLAEASKVTQDIREIKQAVAGQLCDVVRALDVFKREESARTACLVERNERLLEKVAQMEVATRNVQAHMAAERAKATTDALTGLPNRAAYNDRIRESVARWQRYQTSFSIVVGDLDFFKRINDSYGHLAGDKVLRLVGKVIRTKIRSTDFATRYGGEEFVIIMPSTRSREACLAVEKIRQGLVDSPFNFHGKPLTVTMSFGVTEIIAGDSSDVLFSRADKLLYKAKADGRNRVCTG